MNATRELPITHELAPQEIAELPTLVQQCGETKTAIYPRGGGTSLAFGLPASRPGVSLSLAACRRVIDYPARDMTVTVEAGITMAGLKEILAAEGQRLPFDVPQASRATVGGVVATNSNGFRRYGQGTVRDYVIGISAVDGRGTVFKGGGRVVKNVAGYDFCKLLTGSLGTLGIITQLTFKLRPLPEQSVLVACRAGQLEQAERLLAAIGRSETTPSAVELVGGPLWEEGTELGTTLGRLGPGEAYVLVELEGTAAEVRWMIEQTQQEWRREKLDSVQVFADGAPLLYEQLVEFPHATDGGAALQASLRPSHVVHFVAAAQAIAPAVSFQAHAGNGIVTVRGLFSDSIVWSQAVQEKLRPLAAAGDGHLVVLADPASVARTRDGVWGARDGAYEMMTRIKREFDPLDLLNPGRFIYNS